MFEHIVRRRLVDDELPAPLVTLVCSVTTLTVQSPSIFPEDRREHFALQAAISISNVPIIAKYT